MGHTKSELTRSDDVERVTRIELAWPAWKAKPKRPGQAVCQSAKEKADHALP